MKPNHELAVRYLEDLLTFFGLNVFVRLEEEEEGVVMLQIPSTHLNGFLIGQNGETLRALQHLTNMAVKRSATDDLLVTIDVAGYKQQRNLRLAKRIQQLAEQVLETGQDYALRPMSAYDRRVVHKTISELEGVESESHGEGRERKVVIRRAGDSKRNKE